jgi:amino acid transporter
MKKEVILIILLFLIKTQICFAHPDSILAYVILSIMTVPVIAIVNIFISYKINKKYNKAKFTEGKLSIVFLNVFLLLAIIFISPSVIFIGIPLIDQYESNIFKYWIIFLFASYIIVFILSFIYKKINSGRK